MRDFYPVYSDNDFVRAISFKCRIKKSSDNQDKGFVNEFSLCGEKADNRHKSKSQFQNIL